MSLRRAGLVFLGFVAVFFIGMGQMARVEAAGIVDEPSIWFAHSSENGRYLISFFGENISRKIHAVVRVNGEKLGRVYPVRTFSCRKTSGEYELIDTGWLQGKILVPEPGSYEIALKFFKKKTFLFSRSELITIPYPEEPKYSIGFDAAALDNFNALAGTVVALPPIKLSAEGGDGVLQELVLQNKLSARMEDLGPIILYKDPDQVEEVGLATISQDGTVAWKNLDFSFSGVAHLYPFVTVRGVDYSSSPDQFGTATAGRQFQFFIQKSMAINPYSEEESYFVVKPEAKTPIYDLVGAMPVVVFTDFSDRVLQNGISEIFNFSVVAAESGNVDYDDSPLAVKPCFVKFFFDGVGIDPGANNVTLGDFYIQREGSSYKYPLLDAYGNPVQLTQSPEGYYVLASLDKTFGEDRDGFIDPGVTARFTLSAEIVGADPGKFLSVTIRNPSQNFSFRHNTGFSGADGPYSRVFNLNIPGLEIIQGGILSN